MLFPNFPWEVELSIIWYLDIWEIIPLSEVCSWWRTIIRNPSWWQNLLAVDDQPLPTLHLIYQRRRNACRTLTWKVFGVDCSGGRIGAMFAPDDLNYLYSIVENHPKNCIADCPMMTQISLLTSSRMFPAVGEPVSFYQYQINNELRQYDCRTSFHGYVNVAKPENVGRIANYFHGLIPTKPLAPRLPHYVAQGKVLTLSNDGIVTDGDIIVMSSCIKIQSTFNGFLLLSTNGQLFNYQGPTKWELVPLSISPMLDFEVLHFRIGQNNVFDIIYLQLDGTYGRYLEGLELFYPRTEIPIKYHGINTGRVRGLIVHQSPNSTIIHVGY